MDLTKLNKATQMLVKHGSPQLSPVVANQLNEGLISDFVSTIDSGMVRSGFRVRLTGYAEHIRRVAEQQDVYYLELQRILIGLRSTPRSYLASVLKGSVSIFSIENDFYRVDYQINNGHEIFVHNLQLVDRLQKQLDKMEKVALYRVKRNSQGMFEVQSKVDKVTTPFAAVNGQSNNLTKATWLMAQHLEYQFGRVDEYTLFHNPSIGTLGDTWESFRDKIGFTTPVTKVFAKTLEETQRSGNKTQWIAHSQGGAIFSEGVRYLLNGSSSYAINKLQLNGIRNPEKGSLLNAHSVAFHGNANNNLRTKPLMTRAGVNVLQPQANDYDFVHNVIGMNTLNPRKIVGSLVYINHLFYGSVPQSTHTTAQSQADWEKNMKDGPGKGRGLVQKGFNAITKLKPNFLP
jgi:hypothetical protein